MKTDAFLAQAERLRFEGAKVSRGELKSVEPEMAGLRGSANMKFEAAALLYELTPTVARQHLLDLLNHWRDVGIWSVPGPRGPVSEAMSVSHGKHHLRGHAFATWAAWKTNDNEVLALCLILWRQLAAYFTLVTVDGVVYTVGPRAFGLGKPGPKNATGRAGTDSIHDEMGRLWTAPGSERRRMWKGDDFLGVRIVDSLLASGALERPKFNGITSVDLPRTVDPIAIWRTDGAVVVKLLSCSDTTKPGPQWSAAIVAGEQSFQVEAPLVDIRNGFYLHHEDARIGSTAAILTRRPA